MSTILAMAPLHTVFTGRNGRPGARALDDPQELHKTVMHLFGHLGGESPRASGGIIFRVEPPAPGFPGALLIRAAEKPVHAPEGMVIREEGPAPVAGTLVAFRLAANAVRRQKDGGVVPVPRDDAPVEGFDSMTEWVVRKLSGALRDVELINHDRNVTGIRSGRTVQTDLVDGFAVVESQEVLQALLSGGVGRAKNYGCGLLTVKAIG